MAQLDTVDARGFIDRPSPLMAGETVDRQGLSLLVLCRH
jgi:hypothetical protein